MASFSADFWKKFWRFSSPDVEETYKQLTGRDLRDLWNKQPVAQPKPPKGEAP